ncbi:unnamed protein product [Rotaria sp. Silwood2]|nr:unnamed protein product [Rotaria sp. Silwood2]CAF2728661.1 unnamed protein product [Rotaria sp. Silwood2]CAF2896314.1 unnamed protein product [Rotaria sp. Silwood2]CAF4115712.1 unnamed protein product [Rotaria sp. Silwood2]CAF4171901.1 unnamed protein product [Rotaria sp. Silwood2]
MDDLPLNIATDALLPSSSSSSSPSDDDNVLLKEQSNLNSNNTINGTLNLINTSFGISYETMRILFIAIAIITVLICLTICICACIRLYPKRYV